MPLRVSTTGSDVVLDDLGITVTHPTTERDLSLEFTSVELRDSASLTTAIQNGDLDADDGTNFIAADDYDADQLLLQELDVLGDTKYISNNELYSKGDILIYSGVFPLALNSTSAATRNVYAAGGRFKTWDLEPGDIVVISGNTAAGIYTVESVTDQQNFIVVESIVDSTGGIVNIYHPNGASRVGVDDSLYTNLEGDTLQELLESMDVQVLWERETGGQNVLVPLTHGDGIKIYNNDPNNYAVLYRSGGNFNISVYGTDAQALYMNSKKAVHQLGGTSTNEHFTIQNGGDQQCLNIFADRTASFWGDVTFKDGIAAHWEHPSTPTNLLSIWREAENAKISVSGSDSRGLYLQSEDLIVHLYGTSSSEKFMIENDAAGACAEVFADKTSKFHGDVTVAGDLIPDADDTYDIGYSNSTSTRWRNGLFSTSVKVGPSLTATRLTQGQLDGGGSLSFRIGNILDNSFSEFKGVNSTHYHGIRCRYGTSGRAFIGMYHNGSDAYITTGDGIIVFTPGKPSIQWPIDTADPVGFPEGCTWYNETDGKYKGVWATTGNNIAFASEEYVDEEIDNHEDTYHKYPASAGDPSSPAPVDGDTYYNTTLRMQMQYDSSRGKWLSVDTVTLQFGRNGDTVAGGYYRGVNGVLLSATEGYPAMRDGTVIAIAYTRTDTDAATFEVTADGSAIATLASSAVTGKSNSINSDFDEDEILALRNQAGGNTTSVVQCWVQVKWRSPTTMLMAEASILKKGF